MDSELSSRYAFIEHRQPLNKEEDEEEDDDITEYNIDNNIEYKKYTDEELKRKAEILTNHKAWFVDEEGDYMEFFNYWKIYQNYFLKTSN